MAQTPTAFGRFARAELVRVLEEDPSLGEDLRPDAREQAARVPAGVLAVECGTWQAEAPRDPAGTLGLLVLDGLLVRWVSVGDVRCCELLGPGDVLRPWTYQRELGVASIPAEAEWRVLEPTRIAVLDRRFTLGVAPWPEIVAAVLDRAVVRARRVAFHVSVCSLVRLELRLLVALWHCADRWGRVTPEGVHLPLKLTHELLAGLVGARRPSVTVALGRLRDARSVMRRPDGTWLLTGRAPEELRDLRRASALDEPHGAD